MWGIIALLLMVSVATLMMKPREAFYDEVSELDVLKGFDLNFNKTFDALKDKSIGEFKSVTSKDALLEKATVTGDLRVGKSVLIGDNLTLGKTFKVGTQTLTSTDIQQIKTAVLGNRLTLGTQTLTATDIEKLKKLIK